MNFKPYQAIMGSSSSEIFMVGGDNPTYKLALVRFFD